MKKVDEQLVAAGMSQHEASRKADLFSECLKLLKSSNVSSWFVPGRIEVLGKHTDYAGGRSLLCAAERGMCVVARRRDDSTIKITDAMTGESIKFEFCADAPIPISGWAVYPVTVARRLAGNFPDASIGADIAIASDLPRASGMSSSSVLVTAIYTVLAALNGIEDTPEFRANIRSREELAEYLGCIENGSSFVTLAGDAGVGTFGGSEDHAAILRSKPGKLVQYSFCPVRFERSVNMPENLVWVIGVSGVSAPKAASARESYNRVSRSAAAILSLWRRHSGQPCSSLAQAIGSSPDAINKIRAMLRETHHDEFSPHALQQRFEQFLLESERLVWSAAQAVEQGDLNGFGRLVDESQAAAERVLGNQIPETIALAHSAKALGAHAASAFGAGFGGSVWSLVDKRDAGNFCAAWRNDYLARFPAREQASQFFSTAAGPPLLRLS